MQRHRIAASTRSDKKYDDGYEQLYDGTIDEQIEQRTTCTNDGVQIFRRMFHHKQNIRKLPCSVIMRVLLNSRDTQHN